MFVFAYFYFACRHNCIKHRYRGEYYVDSVSCAYLFWCSIFSKFQGLDKHLGQTEDKGQRYNQQCEKNEVVLGKAHQPPQ